MNRQEFYDYILENFKISEEATRFISNILYFVGNNYFTESDQYNALCELLEGTIGLSDEEIKQVCL